VARDAKLTGSAKSPDINPSRAFRGSVELPVVREQVNLTVKSANGDLDFQTLFSTVGLLANKPHVTRPYEESGWVHACLKPIGQAVASVPPRVWIGDPKTDKDAKLLPDEDPLARLFRAPSPLMTGAQFFEAGALHRKLDGEEIWFLLDKNGQPLRPGASLMLDIPAHIISVRGANATLRTNHATGWPIEWSTSVAGGGTITAPAESVIHFRDFNPDDPLRGLGDVESVLLDIDLDWQADRFQRAILANSGDPGGWIKTKGTALAAPEMAALENQANENFDVKNAGRWRILKGDQEYIPNSIKPKDMQNSELKARIRDKIAGVLGVPPIIIGVYEHATLANFAQAVELFWKGGNGILSYLSSVEDVVNARFLSRVRHPSGKRLVFRFDTSGVAALREDRSNLWKLAADIAAQAIGVSLEDAAKLLGLDFDKRNAPHADLRLVMPGVTTVDQLLANPSGEEEIEGGDPLMATEGVDAAAVAGGAKVQDTALNGAQVTGLIEVARAVSDGVLTPDGAVGIMRVGYPSIDEVEASRIANGAVVKPPEPEPDPDDTGPESGPDSGPVDDDSPKDDEAPKEEVPADDEAAKALVLREADTEADTEAVEKARQERRDYWDVKEARLLKGHGDMLRRKYRRFRDAYDRAQFRRLRDYAAEGDAGVRRGVKAADGPDDLAPSPTLRDIEALLLDLDEWRKKFADTFGPAMNAIGRDALDDLSRELGGISLGGVDERVSQAMARQTIKLAEGHTSTLATQVRDALQEALKEEQSSGSLQEIVERLLPELEGSLKEAFSDRAQRAQTIAQTESGKAMNRTRTLGMVEAGVIEHEWVTSKNQSVRGTPGGPYEDAKFSHYELDGKVVRLGELFDPTGHPGLREPGDDNAEPGDVINCACLSRPVVQPREEENA